MIHWSFSVITLFPEMFPGPLGHSLSGKALDKKQWTLNVINLRDFSHLAHRKVDDISFGGDFGLVIRADIVHEALTHALTLHKNPDIIYTSPKGEVFNQSHVVSLRGDEGDEAIGRLLPASQARGRNDIIFLCGRYEGIDDRVIQYWAQNHGLIELSLGDFILSGGELAALTMMDACLRYQTIERKETLAAESFETGLLEYPHYTKPRVWNGMEVPEVLLSGHHQKIAAWKKGMSEKITKERRPDLWEKYL